MKTCGNCGNQVPLQAEFCGGCGSAVALVAAPPQSDFKRCWRCGIEIPVQAEFCGNCGGAAAPGEESSQTVCGSCGNVVEATSTACPNCGISFVQRKEIHPAKLAALVTAAATVGVGLLSVNPIPVVLVLVAGGITTVVLYFNHKKPKE